MERKLGQFATDKKFHQTLSFISIKGTKEIREPSSTERFLWKIKYLLKIWLNLFSYIPF
jgi:hypothetical protein